MTQNKPAKSPFTPLPAKIDLGELDRRIIKWWQAHNVFTRSLEQTAGGPCWVFYEGPPTANGLPGTHHVEARVFKDVFPRYKTMKGYSVPRRAGWDCHGLPVELAVEKELGLAGKSDIEKVGIAQFNARCRESVLRHVGEFEQLTERMGYCYWIDLTHPYQTMSPQYVDSVWWSLQRIHADGLLVEDFRITPYCPRDGTTLSDHEVAQGYQMVTDPSVYVRFPLREPLVGHADVDLLVWTTTPWTLVSNTAVAVHPEATYALARTGRGTFVVAQPLLSAVLGDRFEVLASMPGADLAGLRYRRPFELVEIPDAHLIVPAEYVSTAEGTGLVHLAPAFGADDLSVCRANGLAVVNPTTPNGRFVDEVPLVGGVFFKYADGILLEELKRTGLLFGCERVEHSYPHCWRCHTPLIYYAQPSWYIRTTAVREALLRENEHTNWFPEHIKHGRYGDWLHNNIDWALSRSRYWGTPLPLWRCRNDHITAMVCLGHIVAEDGRKMSKHLGNVLAPIPLMDAHGADALRWFMACSGSPWAPRGVGAGPLNEIVRKVLMTYWNTASFFTLYATHSRWAPETAHVPAERPILDRWILAQAHALAAAVEECLDRYDTARAGRLLAEFIDELSNWYVRRSRPRSAWIC
ncbi:MAG TPA: class I tRNA ligase family protein [Pseudonocardiaceae bacterium]|nr:class I tRNA ligase family protein [Pseudonocardiaceae bacterium]